MDSPQNLLLVGAQVVCYVNANPFGRVSSVNLSIDSPRKKLRAIDTPQPIELIPTTLDVSGIMTIFKLKQDGGIEGIGLMASWANLSYEKYFDMALVDRSTDSIVFHVENCSVESQKWSMNTKGYVIGTVSFSGLLYNYHML